MRAGCRTPSPSLAVALCFVAGCVGRIDREAGTSDAGSVGPLPDGASGGADAPPSAADAGSFDAAVEGCPGLEPIAAPPEELYVAPGGDDGAEGTIGAPLASLSEAASRLSGGGTVIVRGGVYPDQRWFAAAGAPGHPLVFRAAAGETPIFDGEAVTGDWSAVIHFSSAEHVVLEGLEVRNCRAPSCQGIASGAPVLDLTIRGCHIHHIDASACRFAGREIRIEGNDLHDLALTNEDNTSYPGGGWPTCTGTVPNRNQPASPWADDVVIRGNRIQDCWGEGIGLWYAKNAVVEDNVVINGWNVGIYMDNAFEVTVARNYVHMLRGSNGSQGSGILLGTESYEGIANTRTHDIAIVNNVVVAGSGIGWWAMSTPESTYERVSILHNTVVATSRGVLGFSAVESGVESPSACLIVNNVFAQADSSWLGDPDAFSFAGNAWLDQPVPDVGGATDVSLELAVAPPATAEEARPLAALVGHGEAGTDVAGDFVCAPRSATAPTRGAFEE